MTPRIVEAHALPGFVLCLTFADGTSGEVDLSEELDGPVFEPLKDQRYFEQVQVNHEVHTVTWPNGADFAPEFLRDRIIARVS